MKESATRQGAAARHHGRDRVDPRDDFWAGIIRHRDRLRTFTRPVKAAAAKGPEKQRRMTA